MILKADASKNGQLFMFPVKPELSPIWRPKVRFSSDQISTNAIGRRLKEKIRRKSKKKCEMRFVPSPRRIYHRVRWR
jgi:hypothetical protein